MYQGLWGGRNWAISARRGQFLGLDGTRLQPQVGPLKVGQRAVAFGLVSLHPAVEQIM